MNRIILYFVFFFTLTNANAQWVKTTYTPHGSVESMAVCGNTVIVGSQNSGIYLSVDNGKTWSQANRGLPSNNLDVTVLACDDSTLYAGVKYGGFFISSDTGNNWSASNNGIPNSIFFESIALKGDEIFIATSQGVYHSSDKGANWDAVNNGLTDLDVRSIGIIGQNIFAGTYNDGLFISNIDSINWKNINNSFNVNKFITCFTSVSGRIFIGTLSGIFYSDDNGANWIEATTAMDNPTITSLLMIGDEIFAGLGSNDGGIITSSDMGATWKTINDGFPQNPYVSALANNTSTMFAGGPDSWSVWLRPLEEITSIKDTESSLKYSLSQNYPNPFNPTTTIQYNIPLSRGVRGVLKNKVNGTINGTNVQLKVYDLLGREIATLVNRNQKPGSYKVVFDASNFSTGIYFYQLNYGSKRIVKKMMLIK